MINYIHQREGFNPRTPCGVRLRICGRETWIKRFQSTHSLRSATRRRTGKRLLKFVSIHALLAECDRTGLPRPCASLCFNPRTPCGVRLHVRRQWPVGQQVSIHALLAECDGNAIGNLRASLLFQSTHSLRSATAGDGIKPFNYDVSIHALLAECDRADSRPERSIDGFNPRTPCGVRRTKDAPVPSVSISFNPRTPCGVRQ